MSKILNRLELAANTNPAEALRLLPELFRAVHEGIIVELPYPAFTKEQLDSLPKLDKKSLFEKINVVERLGSEKK